MQSLAEGHTKTQDLMKKETAVIRQLIVRRDQKTINYLDRQLQNQRDEQLAQHHYDCLLQSLRYPEMNERRTTIEKSHQNTFKWIYSGRGSRKSKSRSEQVDDENESRENEDEPIDGEDEQIDDDENEQINDEDNKINNWDSFTQFLKGPDKMYWIRGKAGSGKSCLMKFVLQERQTKDAFAQWRPQSSTTFLSHFFWNSGSNMQNSLKGFLMSLMYQLLEHSSMRAHTLLSENPHILRYRNNGDWAISELIGVLKQSAVYEPDANAICIFIDGLDEVDQDFGNFSLIKLVKDLSLSNNVKLCVSSRPEAEFKTFLSACPHLKLEDLTRKDMVTMTRDTLKDIFGSLGRIDRDKLQRLIRMTVEKAEGVFLWVSYVLKSLEKGLIRFDTWEDLEKRLNMLPKGVASLYRDMWKRLNEDETLWREDAAWYFKYLLEYGKSLLRGDEDMILLTLSKNPSLCDKIIQDRAYDEDEFWTHCLETESQMTARCAGLLEFHRFQYHEPDNSAKTSWGTIEFIHRSAREFLETTDDGQDILKFSSIAAKDVLKMRILTTTALVCLQPILETRKIPVLMLEFWENVQAFGATVDEEGETLEFIRLFVQVCQDIGDKEGKSSKPKIFAYMWYDDIAVGVVGSLVAHQPKLALSFIKKFIPNYQITVEYANYLLVCAATKAFERKERVHVIKKECLNLLRYLFERGADPNARIPLWQALTPAPLVTFTEAVFCDEDGLTKLVAGEDFEPLGRMLLEFNWDLKSKTWIILNAFGLQGFGAFNHSWLSAAATLSIIVEATISECVRLMTSTHGGNSFIQDVTGNENKAHNVRKVAFALNSMSSFYSSDDILLKPTDEDANLLASAINRFEAALEHKGELWYLNNEDASRSEEREELWNNIVGQAMTEIRDRCEMFRGEDDIYQELERAGMPILRNEKDVQTLRRRIFEAEPKVY